MSDQESIRLATLRRRAEEQVQQRIASLPNLSPEQVAQLVHELEVHHAELEMQNAELQASQQLLEQSRDRFADLYDFSPLGYITLDGIGWIKEANLTAAAMLEVDRRFLQGKWFGDFIIPEDRHFLSHHLTQCQGTTQDVNTELHLLGEKGRVTPVEIRSIAVNVAEAGRWYRTAITDITKRVEARQALHESEERLRLHVENTPLAVIESGPDFRISRWSGEAERIFGWKAEEVLGRRADEFRWVYEEDTQQVAQISECLADGTHTRNVSHNRNYRKDGSVIYCEWYNSVLADAAGRLRSILSLALDVTERKRAEEQRQQFVSVVENSNEGIAICDLQFRLVYANRAGLQLVGLDSTEGTLGRSIREFFLPEDQPFMMDTFLPQVLRDGRGELEIRVRQFKTGGSLWMSHSIVVLTDAMGKPAGLATVSRDITERKHGEEQLRALNETLEQRVKERTAEAQWRVNQLQQLAAQMTQAEERERRRLSQVLHDHLQQLLVAARLRLGRAVRRVQDEQASAAIAETIGLVKEAIGESRSLSKELSPPILYDGGLIPALVWLGREMEDKYQLPVSVQAALELEPDDMTVKVFVFQAARELLLNAVKHAQASALKIYMSREGDDRLHVLVEDDGSGFDPEVMKRKEGGGGFGLFSIRERLDAIGGQLNIASAPGQGTKATIIAPCKGILRAKLPASAGWDYSPVLPNGTPGRTDRIRVLLADDHPALRKGLADMLLEHPDLNLVGEARDGEESLTMAFQLRPDVIIMDITMPRMDGIEATRQVKQAMPEVKVIGLSMHESEDLAAAMENAGASEYLTKTAPIEDLISAILRVCPRR